ncbi:hypothetical protein V1515DRAFT_605269 [Lipomyces mesembrius]
MRPVYQYSLIVIVELASAAPMRCRDWPDCSPNATVRSTFSIGYDADYSFIASKFAPVQEDPESNSAVSLTGENINKRQ